ncbi:MAG: aminotransferase class V-fold PLP-dependent enzyme [Bryobacteraceae bacterium]
MPASKWNRRQAVAALGLLGAPAAAKTNGPEVYTRVGGRPFINLTATYTINGGTLTWPEVKQAMEEASHYPVNLDELMEKVGERLSRLLGSESAIVTCGAAAALVHATAACVAGADPEKMQQLPQLDGLKNEVVIPRQSRNAYDHAIRSVGVRMVEIDAREEFHAALGPRTAMVAVLGTGEARGKIRLEEMAEAAHKRGVPVLVDAAAELPNPPNPFLSRGADLVAYSGGKILRGPQCAGLLLGRKDLVAAAWMNSSPHHAFGRSMKVGKEEVMGMLAAIEVWRKHDLQAEYRKWEGWLAMIADRIGRIDGVVTKPMPPAGASPFPVLHVSWDPRKIGYTAGEIGRLLLDGDPRIKSHAEGNGHSFLIRPVAMKAGEAKVAAQRLADILRQAPPVKPEPALRPPSVALAGRWEVDLEFVSGSARHSLTLEVSGNQITGTHQGRIAKGTVAGRIDGDAVRFSSSLPVEGTRLPYEFQGVAQAGRMSGEAGLGEYGSARWSARRVG